MKLLFIAPKYSGGIGGYAFSVAEKLKENGFDVTLMHAPHIPIKNLKSPSFAVLSSLKSLFGRESYDVVHAFNVPSGFAMRYSKGQKKVLSLNSPYLDLVGMIHSGALVSIARIVESLVLKWADKLCTDSKMVQKYYKEKFGLDLECLYTPLDPDKFRDITSLPKKENQVAYIGRDSFEKGIDILKSIESKVNGKVVYCTNVGWKEAMTILKASSVIVVPSRMESLPTVIKEAMYLRVPVIATRVGGIPELVTHNITGILVPPNEPKKLIDAINQLLEDKERAKNIADAGYEYVMKNLTWDVLLPKYIKFYENLVNS